MTDKEKLIRIKKFCETAKVWCLIATVLSFLVSVTNVHYIIMLAIQFSALSALLTTFAIRNMVGWNKDDPEYKPKETE